MATTTPILTSSEPQLFVSGLDASCAFFTAQLGFSLAFLFGDPPSYAQVVRDHARLNLRQLDEPVFAGDIRQREALLSATITLASSTHLEQLFRDFQAAAVPFHQPLRTEPWGAKTFIISDPDQNLILFAAPASATHS